MIKKEGKFPVNARVDIDYSGKTPKIKFGYTSKNPKKDAMDQHIFGLHSMVIMIILYFLFAFLISNYPIEGNYPEQCSNVIFNERNETLNISFDFRGGESYRTIIMNTTYKKVITGANITCDGKIYQIKFLKDTTFVELGEKGFYHKRSGKINPSMYLAYLLAGIFLMGVLWYYLSKLTTFFLLKSERYRKGFPKFQAKFHSKRKYMKFKPKDVENKMVEIPYFSNIELDYKAHGDFSKQLQRIKIREHTHYKFKKGKPSKEIKRDIFSWHARFFFKETPKDGYLEVIYR